jgi:hypothetical protein
MKNNHLNSIHFFKYLPHIGFPVLMISLLGMAKVLPSFVNKHNPNSLAVPPEFTKPTAMVEMLPPYIPNPTGVETPLFPSEVAKSDNSSNFSSDLHKKAWELAKKEVEQIKQTQKAKAQPRSAV